jgi:hypothetical protein
MILDGRHRFQACNDSGVTPRFEEYAGTDPAGFVASSCVHRSLTASQRALIAAGFMAYEREQAKARQLTGKHLPPTSPEGDARDRAGARMHVAGSTVQLAVNLLERGSTELIERVRAGEISVNRAEQSVHQSLPVPPVLRKDEKIRIAEIRELAEKGFRVEQMVEKIHISASRIRDIARRANIALPEVGKQSPVLNARRVVEQTVFGLEVSAAALSTLPVSLDGFSKKEVSDWAKSVTESIQAFTTFRNQLRSHANA